MELLRAQSPGFPRRGVPPAPSTRVLLRTLCAAGFLVPDPRAEQNCWVFVIPKSTEKVSMIADLRYLNGFSPQPLPGFRLPTVRDVFGFISKFAPGALWGGTLDLSNFFWSLRLPESARGVFSVQGGWYDSLPFGWNMSPVIAQRTLVTLLDGFLGVVDERVGSDGVLGVFVYLDDVMVLSPSKRVCGEILQLLSKGLQSAGLLVSPKSVLLPSQRLKWLGKVFDLVEGSVANTERMIQKSLAVVLMSCLGSLSVRSLGRDLGVLPQAFTALSLGWVLVFGLYHRGYVVYWLTWW
ncbi:hypothetical protein M569_17475 [Genlisea aurea]|uniref:Reverse transcriptase domain-containing protein n=1 Tax=Genlisea aurea TaxID=192259 RepID=S8D3Y3_9LAMI|nr:hypothetical protein M569_17475 [Genlisea aurea]